jgi:hypothetical protein
MDVSVDEGDLTSVKDFLRWRFDRAKAESKMED